jgi:hypothetical protein
MNELQLRKKTLILESDLNRLTLRSELHDLCVVGGRFRPPLLKLKWFLPLAPVAGYLAIRLLRRRGSKMRRWFHGLKWLPTLYLLWRGYKARSLQN